jgi:hypothetical protein
MSIATLVNMAKKQKTDPPEKKPSAVIRVEGDIAHMLNTIASWRKKDVPDIASPILRAKVEQLFAEVHREMGKTIGTLHDDENT